MFLLSPASHDDSGRHDLQSHDFAHHRRPAWMPQEHTLVHPGCFQLPPPYPHCPCLFPLRELPQPSPDTTWKSDWIPTFLSHSSSAPTANQMSLPFEYCMFDPTTFLSFPCPHPSPNPPSSPNAFLCATPAQHFPIKQQPERCLYNVGQTRALLARSLSGHHHSD